jgi:AAA15 family ATPase/GTPase
MLLEFKVKNFRSIRDECTFSLVANNSDREHQKTHLHETGIKKIPYAVNSAAIYGANASGKTNLIKAISYFRNVVNESANLGLDQTFNFQHFRLDESSAQSPTEFEATFVVRGVRYQYGFTLIRARILEEWLIVYNSPKGQEWFTRKYNEVTQQYHYDFGPYLKGAKRLWEGATKDNNLFLSMAAKLNSDMLKDVFTMIRDGLVIFENSSQLPAWDTTLELLDNEKSNLEVKNFLLSADFSISELKVRVEKGIHKLIKFDQGKVEFTDEEREVKIPYFQHATSNGVADIEFHDESTGSQKLFNYSGLILNVLAKGATLIVDELSTSLHPFIVEKLVDTFNSPVTNPHGAQLIFTTHDTYLLDTKILRRDQIWFTEKGNEQQTVLYPLTDFAVRKTDHLDKAYLMGKYGAVPILRQFLTRTI